MKKLTLVAIVAMAIVSVSVSAMAKDVLLKGDKIVSISTQNDKNGNEYTRIFIKQDRSLNGVAYHVSVPIMAFGETAALAQNLEVGSEIHAICKEGSYKGSKSYQLLAIIKE